MRSDSVKNMSACADQNHAPSLTDIRLEFLLKIEIRERNFVLGLCEMEALKIRTVDRLVALICERNVYRVLMAVSYTHLDPA